MPDDGPPLISKDFKKFVRISGMTHARSGPYFPSRIARYSSFIKQFGASALVLTCHFHTKKSALCSNGLSTVTIILAFIAAFVTVHSARNFMAATKRSSQRPIESCMKREHVEHTIDKPPETTQTRYHVQEERLTGGHGGGNDRPRSA